ISIMLFLIFITFGQEIALALGSSEIVAWVYFVPFSVFFLGLYNALNYRLLWLRNYKASASGKVVMSGSNAFSNVSLGALGFTKFGLIFGNIASYLVSTTYLMKENRNAFVDFRKTKKAKVYALLKRYKSFPLENLPSA